MATATAKKQQARVEHNPALWNRFVNDPLGFKDLYWPGEPYRDHQGMWRPKVEFAGYQRQIALSLRDNKETYVVSANRMGKDYISGFLILWFFLTRDPCRILLTSTTADHLVVIEGEMGGFLASARYPLLDQHGGVLVRKHFFWRKNYDASGKSYIIGKVAAPDSTEGMGGHHVASTDGIPRTLLFADEASGINDANFDTARPWTHRVIAIGNAWPTENWYKAAFEGRPGSEDKGGDILA